jgi:hypothetical protein
LLSYAKHEKRTMKQIVLEALNDKIKPWADIANTAAGTDAYAMTDHLAIDVTAS